MKLTNKYDVPDLIYRAVGDQFAPQVGRVGVTTLIDAPLVRILRMKHWNEIEEDVGDRMWALLGQAVHSVIERAQGHMDISEKKMERWVGKMKLVGKPDVIENNGTRTLIDLKITSVYSYLLGDKPAWVKQLNIYRWLAHHAGIEIDELKVYAILRDWQKSKIFHDHNYPKLPFHVVDIEKYDLKFLEQYVLDRMMLHAEGDKVVNEALEIPEHLYCTPEERWQRTTTYAIKAGQNKRAVRVFKSEEEAKQYCSQITLSRGPAFTKKWWIEERPGLCVRCEDYCSVKNFCPAYRAIQEAESENVSEED